MSETVTQLYLYLNVLYLSQLYLYLNVQYLSQLYLYLNVQYLSQLYLYCNVQYRDFCQILIKLYFAGQISEKFSNIKFYKNP